MVRIKNRASGLLLETGVMRNKQRLHQVKHFRELMADNQEVSESMRPFCGSAMKRSHGCRRRTLR